MGPRQLYRWYQDNHSVTVDFFVPQGTLPSNVRLLLSRRSIALQQTQSGHFLIRRVAYAPINPSCTCSYAMPDVAEGEPSILRAVIYKAVQAGWISLFQGDPPSQGLVPSPAPLSHTMAHVAALARSREVAARESAALATTSVYVATQSARRETWRSGCQEIKMRTPGGIKIHYGRNKPQCAEPLAIKTHYGHPGHPARHARYQCLCEPWRAVRRHVPTITAAEAYVALLQAPPTAAPPQADETADRCEAVPSREEVAAAKAAIEAVRKGNVPTPPQPESNSSDEEECGGWEGGSAHPDDIEYPLPGSDASCDGCGQIVNQYYHCVQCGIIDGFDLCEQCKRMGLYPDKHERRFPNHTYACIPPLPAIHAA